MIAAALTLALATAGGRLAEAVKVEPALRGALEANVTRLNATTFAHLGGAHAQAPCQCTPSSPSWAKCARVEPACVFIDLGAADGNSFNAFLTGAYGPLQNCPSGKWMAFLVEANPRFNAPLAGEQAKWKQAVHVMSSTAAFACEGTTTFYLDTTNHAQNYWGSSMSPNHVDAKSSGLQAVVVNLMNLNRLLLEQTIPADWVMVKMDIEGAEWDVVPCLAKSDAASLIDRLYMEKHPGDLTLFGTTQADMDLAETSLKQRGIDIPQYYSDTL